MIKVEVKNAKDNEEQRNNASSVGSKYNNYVNFSGSDAKREFDTFKIKKSM